MANQPKAGWLSVHHRNVVWEMSARDARELADYLDLVASPDDQVHHDAAALREWADRAVQLKEGPADAR